MSCASPATEVGYSLQPQAPLMSTIGREVVPGSREAPIFLEIDSISVSSGGSIGISLWITTVSRLLLADDSIADFAFKASKLWDLRNVLLGSLQQSDQRRHAGDEGIHVSCLCSGRMQNQASERIDFGLE